LVTETELEFSKEIDKKQAVIDDLHTQLRDASGELGEQRRHLEGLQAELNERESRKRKTSNLLSSYDEEGSHLSQLQAQYGQVNGDTEAQLGDADTGLGISPKASPVLSKITSDHQGPMVGATDRQFLASTLPPLHCLRARVNAYAENNKALEGTGRGLQSKSSELANKYRTIIGLCTGVEDTRVDEQLDNLLRAVESEPTDVELGRVRDFLVRIEN
jgi:regulatory protein SWI6